LLEYNRDTRYACRTMATFNYTELTYDDRLSIHEALAETTVKHIESSGGLFSPMLFDAAASPSQLLETTHLYPAPAKFDGPLGINQLSDIAAKNMHHAIVDELKRQRPLVSMSELHRKEGRHQFHLTTHQKMIDVAEFAVSWAEATQHDNWQENNGIGISRGVTTIEAFGMAASEVAQKAGHVFMSFPRTRTIMNLTETFKANQKLRQQLDPDAKQIDLESLIETNNKNMRTNIREWLGVDPSSRVHRLGRHATGKYFNWAISGATDLVQLGDDHRPESIRLGKVSRGVTDVLKHGLALPIVLWDRDDPIVEIGEVTVVKNQSDIDKVQEWQRSTLAYRLGLSNESVTVEKT